jgi:DNA-binding CsgD family transcriptional regulator
VRHARGRLHRARGLEEEAASDFLAAGRALLRAGTPTPAAGPWRSDAALALAASGFAERAGELAAEELGLARRADAPRALGIALRAAALLGPAPARAAGLEDAAARLRSAGSPVELARTLVDAGLAQLREGRREAGRASLREALDLADRHHADAVAARAQTELRVAGARPRRCRLSGIEALTPAELRIARLAGEGRTNREIAAALFLSPKTVESHLGRVYAKLDVRHRRELAALLAAAATT